MNHAETVERVTVMAEAAAEAAGSCTETVGHLEWSDVESVLEAVAAAVRGGNTNELWEMMHPNH